MHETSVPSQEQCPKQAVITLSEIRLQTMSSSTSPASKSCQQDTKRILQEESSQSLVLRVQGRLRSKSNDGGRKQPRQCIKNCNWMEIIPTHSPHPPEQTNQFAEFYSTKAQPRVPRAAPARCSLPGSPASPQKAPQASPTSSAHPGLCW